MWDLLVSIPDHCLSFYFVLFNRFWTIIFYIGILMFVYFLLTCEAKPKSVRSVTKVGDCYWACFDSCDEYGVCYPKCDTICP